MTPSTPLIQSPLFDIMNGMILPYRVGCQLFAMRKPRAASRLTIRGIPDSSAANPSPTDKPVPASYRRHRSYTTPQLNLKLLIPDNMTPRPRTRSCGDLPAIDFDTTVTTATEEDASPEALEVRAQDLLSLYNTLESQKRFLSLSETTLSRPDGNEEERVTSYLGDIAAMIELAESTARVLGFRKHSGQTSNLQDQDHGSSETETEITLMARALHDCFSRVIDGVIQADDEEKVFSLVERLHSALLTTMEQYMNQGQSSHQTGQPRAPQQTLAQPSRDGHPGSTISPQSSLMSGTWPTTTTSQDNRLQRFCQGHHRDSETLRVHQALMRIHRILRDGSDTDNPTNQKMILSEKAMSEMLNTINLFRPILSREKAPTIASDDGSEAEFCAAQLPHGVFGLWRTMKPKTSRVGTSDLCHTIAWPEVSSGSQPSEQRRQFHRFLKQVEKGIQAHYILSNSAGRQPSALQAAHAST